jgi:hypothetical protein
VASATGNPIYEELKDWETQFLFGLSGGKVKAPVL